MRALNLSRAVSTLSCAFCRIQSHFQRLKKQPRRSSSPRPLFADERAQAAVLTALCMVVVMGFVGLAVDVGQLRFEKRRLQNAADAAALAASFEISTCAGSACSIMRAAAQSAVCENGYKLQGTGLPAACTSSTSGVALTVNNGPSTLGAADPNAGNATYAEVLLTESQPLYFARMLGFRSMNISARAEGTSGSSNYCLYLLNPSGTSLQLNAATLRAQCGIMINSSSSSALAVNSSTLTASPISIHGNYTKNVSTINGTISTGVTAAADPLSYIPTPTSSGCGSSNASPFYGATGVAVVNTGTATFNPGTYCQGIVINAGTATFNPGTYIIQGWMQVNAGSISGNGVTFYLSVGSIQFNAAAHIALVAPTTGTYAGILFDQSATDGSAAQLNADSSSSFQGALYFPDATLQLNASNTAAYTIVDAAQVQMNSSTFSLNDDYSSLPGGSPIKGGSAVLVE